MAALTELSDVSNALAAISALIPGEYTTPGAAVSVGGAMVTEGGALLEEGGVPFRDMGGVLGAMDTGGLVDSISSGSLFSCFLL